METIYINQERCKIHKAGEHILITKDGKKVATSPLEDTHTIIANTSVQFTSQAIDMLFDKQIDVIFMSTTGKIRGQMLAQKRSGIIARLAQYQLFLDPERRLTLARSFVCGKIANQREVIRKARVDGAAGALRKQAAQLDRVLRDIGQAGSIEEVMGFEGIAARHYFEAVRHMLRHTDFVRREYRPAKDIVNSALNLGYAFLANEATLGIRSVKLDPELGFLHSIHYGRNSLPLDLMEEFRAPFIDAWIIRMFNKNMLTDFDFEGVESSYYFTKDGYRSFCGAYQQHLFEKQNWRALILSQARKLRKCVMEGVVYEPYQYA